ncbi:MAG: TonB-dependent receptor [Thermodesulfobacteriota bacterium]
MANPSSILSLKSLVGACLAGLIAAGAALAAESGQPGSAPGGSASLGEITVTATKTATPVELLPVTAYSVDQQDIEAQPSHYMANFGELIRDLPGVHVAQYYPWGPPWVHLRGTGYFIGRTAFLVDGAPVTPFMSQTIHNQDIKRVDVLLGPSSALYGANASGGAVNIITKSGKDQRAAKAGAGYGSYDTWRTHASVGDKEGNLDYYFSYNGDYSGGYAMKPVNGMIDLYKRGKTQYLWDASYENNRYEYNYMMGKAGWENSKGMGLVANYNYETLYLYGGQPGLVLNDNGSQGLGQIKFYSPIADFMKITATAGYQLLDRPGKNIQGLTLVNNQLRLNTTPTTRTEWTNQRIPLELQTDFYLAKNNTLTAGAFWSQEKETRETYSLASGARTAKTDYTTDQTAFYLQDQMFLLDDKLSLLAGVRWDQWKYHDVFDQVSTPQRPDGFSKDQVTYRGGAKYRFNEYFALRSSAGTAYWPGTATWFFNNTRSGMTWREANPGLEPEKTWMVDLGAEFTLPKQGTMFSVTPYYGEITDMVSYRYDVNPAVPGGTIIRTQNLGKAEISGVELMLQQRLTDKLSLFGALTLNSSKLKDAGANTDNQLRNAPDYWGSLGLRYLNPALFNAQAVLRFSDDRYYDDENTDLPYFHMGAYETVDAKVWKDWKLSDKWVLTTGLSGNNLLDREYATEIVYVNPGLTVQADFIISYRF